jgi:lipoate-protein ligase A
VKLRAGVSLAQRAHKAAGGLMRAAYQLHEGRLHEVNLSGDFFSYPAEAVAGLEAVLEGVRQDEAEAVIGGFYARNSWETPGVSVGDWLKVLGG